LAVLSRLLMVVLMFSYYHVIIDCGLLAEKGLTCKTVTNPNLI